MGKRRIRPTPVLKVARPKRRIRPTLLRRNAPGEAIRLIAANKALEMKAKQMRGSGGNKQFYSRVRRELPGAVRKTERMIRGSGCYPVKAHRRCSGPRSGKSVKQKAPKKRAAKKSKPPTAAELQNIQSLVRKKVRKGSGWSSWHHLMYL